MSNRKRGDIKKNKGVLFCHTIPPEGRWVIGGQYKITHSSEPPSVLVTDDGGVIHRFKQTIQYFSPKAKSSGVKVEPRGKTSKLSTAEPMRYGV